MKFNFTKEEVQKFINKVEPELKGLGIEIWTDDRSIKPFWEIMDELSELWNNL